MSGLRARGPAAAAALYVLAVGGLNDTNATADLAGATYVHGLVQLAASAAYMTHPTLQGSSAQVDVRSHVPTVEKLSITAHGIDIYKEIPGVFFHSYTLVIEFFIS